MTTSIDSQTKLLTESQVADILNLRVATLRHWRWLGVGPKFIKIGAAVRYHPEQLKDYLVKQVRSSTSDPGPERAAERPGTGVDLDELFPAEAS